MYNSYEYIMHRVKNATPLMRYNYDEDFTVWQKKAKEKLEELLGLPFEKCDDLFKITSEKDFGFYKRCDFEFQSEENYFVKGSFLSPKDIKKPLPVAICLQGHSTGMHISFDEAKFENDEKAIAGGRNFAVRAVKEGICAVAIEQRYMGLAGQNEKGSPACISDFRMATPTLLLGRCAIGERVWDIMRLIDVLLKYFSEYVDMNKIICLGNSGGGTATFYASCLEERISISVPSCAFCTYEDSIMAMDHCDCNYIPGIRKYFEMGDLAALTAPRRLLIVSGKEDGIFPIEPAKSSFEIVKKIYKMLGKEELCRHLIGDKGHQFYPDEVWPIIHKYIGGII